MSLLNTTVQSLTQHVNRALTAAFLDIYGDDDEDDDNPANAANATNFATLGLKPAGSNGLKVSLVNENFGDVVLNHLLF